MGNNFKKYLKTREIKKVTSFRVSSDLLDRVNKASKSLNVPVCSLWEAAMKKTLEDLDLCQKKKVERNEKKKR